MDRRPSRLSPDWARESAKTAAALLTAEIASLQRARAALRRVADSLTAGVVALPESKTTPTATLLAIQGAIDEATTVMVGATLATRRDARAAGLDRLHLELEVARAKLIAAGVAVPDPITVRAHQDTPIDAARADIAGRAYASAIGVALLVQLRRWQASDGRASLGKAITDAFEASDYRVTRIVATENASAFSAARDEGMGATAETHGSTRWAGLLAKQWDTTLDRKTCKRCWRLDGTIRLWGRSWPDGVAPGDVHPRCRCFPATVLLPIPRQGEVTPGRYVDDQNPRDTLR